MDIETLDKETLCKFITGRMYVCMSQRHGSGQTCSSSLIFSGTCTCT